MLSENLPKQTAETKNRKKSQTVSATNWKNLV